VFFDVKHVWSYVDHKNTGVAHQLGDIIGKPIYVGCYVGLVKEHLVMEESNKHYLKIEFNEKVSYFYLLSLGIPQGNILSPYKA